MKKTFIFISLAVLAAAGFACGPKTHPELTFDGEKYALAFSAQQPAGRVNEYLLPGEELDTYTKMVGVYSFPSMKGKTPREAAEMLAALIHAQDPRAPYELHDSADKKAALVDFLVFSPGASMAEYNVFKYAPDGKSVKAVQFVARWYAMNGDGALDNARDFAQNYLGNREEWVKKVDALPFPSLYREDFSIDPDSFLPLEGEEPETPASAPSETPAAS